MKIKTFFAETMAEALRDIKAEFGPDALLLSTRETLRKSGVSRSMFEVVAAVDAADDCAQEARAPEPENPGSVRLAGGDVSILTYTPASLRSSAAGREAARPRRRKQRANLVPESSGTRMAGLPDAVFEGEAPAALYRDLTANGVHDWLARSLLTRSLEAVAPRQRRSRASLLRALRAVGGDMVARAPSAGGLPASRILLFVGPTGVGKTTSIAKLAARLALGDKKKVALMSLDGYRIGAVEQLRSYAALIGLPFRFVNEPSDLPAALAEQEQKDFVLIDTAGRSPKDAAALEELVQIGNAAPEMERHLVLSATSKACDLQQTVERYATCRIDRLLFTKLDETTTLGPILNELVHAQKPLSYYTDGQRVPEDLHVLPKERIIDFVLQES